MTLENLDTAISFVVVILLLSLLITVVVQAIVAAVNLRGRTLVWGVRQILSLGAPSLEERATGLAKKILRHRAVAPPLFGVDRWRRFVPAIRPDELVRLIKTLPHSGTELLPEESAILAQLRGASPGSAPSLSSLRERLRSAGEEGSTELDTLLAELEEALAKAKARVDQLEREWGAGESRSGKASEASARQAELASEVRDVVRSLMPAHGNIEERVREWFAPVMDRTTELFVRRTRLITAMVAIAAAFGLHIDSLEILKQLSSDPELRAGLVQSASVALQEAEETLSLKAARESLASNALVRLRPRMADRIPPGSWSPIPANVASRSEAEAYLRATVSPTNQSAALELYDEILTADTKNWMSRMGAVASNVRDTLAGGKLILIPDPMPSLGEYFTRWRHGAGTLMTALLLSLGAPFWFNALRNLANLRPIIASRVDAPEK